LLSLMPGMSTWGGMMQAPATTGPAKGPLPASSTPAHVQSCLQAWLWARMGTNLDEGIGMSRMVSMCMSMCLGSVGCRICVQQQF